jgi:hypothetical protein
MSSTLQTWCCLVVGDALPNGCDGQSLCRATHLISKVCMQVMRTRTPASLREFGSH